MDLTRTDVSYAVTEAFRCGKIVLACATYDGFLFPADGESADSPQDQELPEPHRRPDGKRHLAPMAAKLMRAELESMKNITLCENVVTIRSAANAAARHRWTPLPQSSLQSNTA